jgi:hypothetical protein
MFFKFHFMCSLLNSQYHMTHIATVPPAAPQQKQKSSKSKTPAKPKHPQPKKQAQPPLRLLAPGLPET